MEGIIPKMQEKRKSVEHNNKFRGKAIKEQSCRMWLKWQPWRGKAKGKNDKEIKKWERIIEG